MEGRGGFWGHLVGLTDWGSAQKVGVSVHFSSLGLRKGLTAFVCFVGKTSCSRMPCECCWRLSFMLISVSVFTFFFPLVIQEFGDVFSKGFMRESSKGTTARGKS